MTKLTKKKTIKRDFFFLDVAVSRDTSHDRESKERILGNFANRLAR